MNSSTVYLVAPVFALTEGGKKNKKSPNELSSTHAGECKVIAETILLLHHRVSKIVCAAISRKETYSSSTDSKL